VPRPARRQHLDHRPQHHVRTGGVDNVSFPATTARYVRMTGVKRGTSYGYFLYAFEVYAH
jgi:hypothetical protein